MFNPPHPHNPNNRLPVSVEDVNGFLNLAKNELGDNADLCGIFQQLAQNVHPLALGAVSRSRDQIKMLAGRLLEHHMKDKDKRDKVIAFLCSESGSHDYTINRREAERDLSLPVEKPDDELYNLIKDILMDIRTELKLREPFDPAFMVANASDGVLMPYKETMALLESSEGGSDQYQRIGNVFKMTQQLSPPPGFPGVMPPPVPAIYDQATFEGWAHVKK